MIDKPEADVTEQNKDTNGETTLFPISPESPFKVTIEKSLESELTTMRRPEELPVYGLILGERIREEGGGFRILELHPAGSDVGGGMTVFKKDRVLSLRREALSENHDLEIFGWYAIHDLGLSPNSREEDTHRLFFAESWNLFLVADNSRERISLFRFEGGALRETMITTVNIRKTVPRSREHKTLLAEIERLKSEKEALEKALKTKAEASARPAAPAMPGAKIIDRPLCTRGDRERQMQNLARSMAQKQGRMQALPPAGGKVIQMPTAPAQKFLPAEMSAFGKRMLFLAGATLVLLVIVAVVSILAEQSGDSQALYAPGNSEEEMFPLDEFRPAPPAPPAPATPSTQPIARPQTPLETSAVEKTHPADRTESAREYVVQPGDNAWKIAEKTLGNGALGKKILAFNGLGEKAKLKVGQKLNIPSK